MRTVTTILLRLIGVRPCPETRDWWAYFGSFGDDFFCDDELVDV